MDATHKKILSLLQEDGRRTTTELAAEVGMSLSSCHRRVRELETSGAIQRYRAEISPEALGLRFEALIFVTMGRTDQDTVAEFEGRIAELPAVVTAQRLFGNPDYMLRVLTEDLPGYQRLYDSELGSLPGVQRLNSTMVMKRIGVDGTIPV